jgi:DNA-binding response OmpR family regulator
MLNVLICSIDPAFGRDLRYAIQQKGHNVEVVTRTALAAQMAFVNSYDFVVMDSGAIGLSAIDAAEVILRACENTQVIVVGGDRTVAGVISVSKPLNIEEINHIIQGLCEPSLKN